MDSFLKLLINLISTAVMVAIIRWLCDGNVEAIVYAFGSVILFQIYNTQDMIRGE